MQNSGHLVVMLAVGFAIAVLSLFTALLGAEPALPSGEPDPNCSDLRLWLRADAGVRDAAGHSPSDPAFSGWVTAWSDQSARHFDLAAPPERAPWYVDSQPGAGNRATVAFGGGRMLARPNDTLHDHANSTTLLVLQIKRGRQQGNFVFCAGNPLQQSEALFFPPGGQSDASPGCVRWLSPASNGLHSVDDPLQIAADGRFAVVTLHSGGENSWLEIQDGLGDFHGANRRVFPPGIAALSDRCGRGYCLGGQKLDQPHIAYDGQIAEVLVYNRALLSAERRTLVSYLRRKYELDVLEALYPAGTMLMHTEDFDGPWQFVPRRDPAAAKWLGHSMQRTVLISQPGKFAVWVFGLDFDLGKESGLRASVGGKPLAVTHVQGLRIPNWQLAGTVDLPAGETEIAVRGEGPGRKECDAVLISPTITTEAGVEEICALARWLRQAPGPGQLAAVFDDGRRIEGNLVSGWRGSGLRIARDGPGRPALRCLRLDGLAADAAPQPDTLLEFHNGDRLRGTICGYVAASTEAGRNAGAEVLVQPSREFSKAGEKPIGVEIDWLQRITFDTDGPPRDCPPRSLVCRDGRVLVFRALRFSNDGVSLLTDQGLVRLAYRDLLEIGMPPSDAWDAYYRQLAEIDPQGDAGIIRLETRQGSVLTASESRVTALRGVWEQAASACLVRPAWSRTPIPVAWSAVRTLSRAPSTVVPLSLVAPQTVTQHGALGSSWKWQVDRNVAGGKLRSGGVGYLWGFGIHAPNALVFRLPDSARAFRCDLGIDDAVGESGCVVAKVFLNEATGTPVFQSKPLLGAQLAISTGEITLARGNSAARQLVLVVEDGGEARAARNPLDIGDHADWLEPTLVLDPVKLRTALEKYRLGK